MNDRDPNMQAAEDLSDSIDIEASSRAPAETFLFEVSWEVCNQLGGIYSVLRSKAPLMVERWGNQYCLVGPYEAERAGLEFEASRPHGWLARVLKALSDEGLHVHHGRWLIPGRPRVLLIEHWQGSDRLAQAKYRLWQDHGVESPPADGLIDGVVSLSDAVRRLMEKACDPKISGRSTAAGASPKSAGPRKVIAHFHEWMGGLTIPMIRRQNLPVATVFTTHATQLGRYMSSEDGFYDWLPFVDPEAGAARYGVKTQHQAERACAHGAHVFTTVSAITGEECSSLIGRTPDLILPNALNIEHYDVGHEFQTLHAQFKERINSFVMGHFFPSYSFDLDKTLYFFTSGRFEPRNKGFDLCLEAMARLNAELRAANLGVTVVFFIVTQRPYKTINPLVMQSRGVLTVLREVCNHITEEVGEKLFRSAAAGQKVKLDELVDDYWRLRFRRTQHALKANRLPFITTHIMEDDATDAVLNQIRNVWLFNRHDDPVKVVYHPEFISPVSPLWRIEYDQFVRGCHMGIFPSAYEPWGYTPMECVAMGVPAVSSDLAGFGRYVNENYPDHNEWGLSVIRRRGRSFQDSAADLAQVLLRFCRLSRRERIQLRNDVEKRSWEFDWSKLGQAYHRAHDLAAERCSATVG